jgi:predicted Zn-dependent peptidase
MHIISNTYKTIQIALFFTDIESNDTRLYRFLLPRLLSSHTDTLNTRLKMNEKLENLYGAYFRSRVERVGNLSVISIVLNIVDPKIINDYELFIEAVNLLHDVVFHNEIFNSEIFNEEIRMLVEQWESYKDNKRLYAQNRFNTVFFDKDHYGKPLSGTKSEIKKANLDDLYQYYKQQFIHNQRDIIINGRLDDAQIRMIENMFSISNPIKQNIELSFRKHRKLKRVEEKTTNLQQAIIKMGFVCPIYRTDPLFHAAVIVDTILGGYPESRLFKTIREEKGLCYDISSSYDHYKGFFLISSGVMEERKNEAIESILALVNQMIQEGVTNLEIDTAKSYYRYQIKSSLDQQSFLTRREFVRIIFNIHETIEERLNAIDLVKKEDIMNVLSMIKLDTIYVLTGGEND